MWTKNGKLMPGTEARMVGLSAANADPASADDGDAGQRQTSA